MPSITADQVVLSVIELLCKKNEDYGSENIAMTGTTGIVVRLTDKIYRLKNLLYTDSSGSFSIQFESLDDTLRDIVGYCIIALMLKDKLWGKKGKEFHNIAMNYMDYFANVGLDGSQSVYMIMSEMIPVIQNMNEKFIIHNTPIARGFETCIILLGRHAVKGLMLRDHIDKSILKSAIDLENSDQ